MPGIDRVFISVPQPVPIDRAPIPRHPKRPRRLPDTVIGSRPAHWREPGTSLPGGANCHRRRRVTGRARNFPPLAVFDQERCHQVGLAGHQNRGLRAHGVALLKPPYHLPDIPFCPWTLLSWLTSYAGHDKTSFPVIMVVVPHRHAYISQADPGVRIHLFESPVPQYVAFQDESPPSLGAPPDSGAR